MADLDWLSEGSDTSEADEINEIASNLRKYYMWPLLVLGVPGNALTIITLFTMGKMTPAAFFIAMLAGCDLAALLTKFAQLQMIDGKVMFGNAGCKMFFLPIYFSILANWMLALIALERFISVCYPLQKMHMFTKKRSYIIAAVLMVVFLAILVPIFAVVYEASDDGVRCGIIRDYRSFWEVWYWINASLVLFLPFLLCVFFSFCIIRGLYRSRRDRRSILNKDGVSNSNSRLLKETERIERMLTIMLILATCIFLILSLPSCIYFLANKKDSGNPDDDAVKKAKWGLFNQIQYLSMNSSHAINFFIYFLSAKRFRNQFISIITCSKNRNKRSNDPSDMTDSTDLSSTTRRL